MSTDSIDHVEVAPPVGASTWERALYEHLVTHTEREQGLLAQYEAAAVATGSKAFAYVVDLLAEDERRHHALLAALVDTVKTEAELTGVEPAVPRLDFDRGDDPQAVRELTARLLGDEEADRRALERIHKELREVRHTTLWDLIIDLMRRDTDKHIAMLEFVRRHMVRPEW